MQILKFENAVYKAFKTRMEAEIAFADHPKQHFKRKTTACNAKNVSEGSDKPNRNSLSVDAACNTKTGVMEYQGVLTNTSELLFHKGPFYDATNNIGEFLAIVHGLALLKQKNSNLPIYSDSLTAIKWVRDKKANTKLVASSRNAEIFELLQRAEFWLKNNTWNNAVMKWETDVWGEIPADFGRK